MAKSYRQIKAIEANNKKRLLDILPSLTEESGIYILTREENGIKYGYVGQAKHLLTRLADHLKVSCGIYGKDNQHIDHSIKKHGFYSEENPTGYIIMVAYCAEKDLDKYEQFYIKEYANMGYQLRNKTLGGQGKGKKGLDNNTPRKGYREGVAYGYNKARKEIKHLFDLHLNAIIRSDKPNKRQEKALQKFNDFLDG